MIAESEVRFEMCEYCQRFDLLDMINDTVLLIDAKTEEVIFMNQKALQMYRYEQQEASGLSIMNLSNESRETVCQNISRIIEQAKRGHVFTALHGKKDGTIFKVVISARSLVMHGKPVIAALVRDAAVEDNMRQEIEIAGNFQRLLLPKDMETPQFLMKTVYRPLHGLSGDLYDIKYNEDSQTLFGVIFDVMGHGIIAARQGGILQYLFQRAVDKHIAVSDKLAWINNEVMPFFSSGGFAAALLFALDFKTKTLTYSSAGVSHFICLTKRGIKVVKCPGLFLGINENEAYDEGVIPFQTGDSFFFMTDGLFELLDQPLEQNHTFTTMHDLCNNTATNRAIRDDASGISIHIH